MMAEALAAIGVAANIIQLVDFGSRTLTRLEQYNSKLGDMPEIFRHIKAELPVLLDALRQTQTAIDLGSIPDTSARALLPVIEGCTVQIGRLDDIILKVLPIENDSWSQRQRKAFGSLRSDTKVRRITAVIREYVQTLTFHSVARSIPSIDLYRPIPSSTVPFRRDPQFVDRNVFKEMDFRIENPASRLALVGLGGVGKSQLAVEYAYRLREKLPSCWVFWVHAGNIARLMEDYRAIAKRIKLSGWDQPDVDILRLVYYWLCDESNGQWMMIVDNADDLDVFTCPSPGSNSQATQTPLDYLPQSPNGRIIITSRSRDVAFRLTGNYADIIMVHPMDQAHASDLLQNKINVWSGTQEEAEDLVEALGYMPLAISQAAAYINQRAPRATVSTYLEDLRKSDYDKARLLQMDFGDSRRDGMALNSIAATWQMSFEYIQNVRPSATQLLSLMSLFDRQCIPENLLDGQYHDGSGTSADFEEDLATLLSFSLVATDVDEHHFRMHRLVQFSTIRWLGLRGSLESWKEKYILLMKYHYPQGRYENWKACQELLPHVQAAVLHRPTSEELLTEWASVLLKATRYANDVGNSQAAQEMAQSALEAIEPALGPNHLLTLELVSAIAEALRRQGKLEGAERAYRRVLHNRTDILGPNHPATLTSLRDIGLVLAELGSFQEAETTQRRALQEMEKVNEPDYSWILISLCNLGLLLAQRGNYNEAELIHRRALKGREDVLGPDHPDTLTSMDNLAIALGKQSKYDEAELMHRQALEGSKRILGEKHPDTLTCARNLASVLNFTGRYEEAESLHNRVLADSLKVLGEEHPFTLISLDQNGLLLFSQQQYQKSMEMHQTALARRSKVLGKEHPHTISSMNNLAPPLKKLGRDQEAIALMEDCLRLRRKILGTQHPDTQKSAKTLAEWTKV